jgi:hypothetical protein
MVPGSWQWRTTPVESTRLRKHGKPSFVPSQFLDLSSVNSDAALPQCNAAGNASPEFRLEIQGRRIIARFGPNPLIVRRIAD